jgi:hypothetical protein
MFSFLVSIFMLFFGLSLRIKIPFLWQLRPELSRRERVLGISFCVFLILSVLQLNGRLKVLSGTKRQYL